MNMHVSNIQDAANPSPTLIETSLQSEMAREKMLSKYLIFLFPLLFVSLLHGVALDYHQDAAGEVGSLVKREERSSLVDTEYGRISAIRISNGERRPYYLQFITLEPSSLFLPVLLHADMVLYVHTGSGRLSCADEDGIRRSNIRRGDISRLQPGSVLSIESDLEPEREKLRIYALFSNTEEESFEPAIGAYTSITDLILGFDKKVLQSAFKVPQDVIEELFNATRPQAMVHTLPKKEKSFWDLESRFLKSFIGGKGGMQAMNSKKKKTKTYNILDADPDFQNCNGWSITVDRKNLRLLKQSNIGIFMVNLTKGSMVGPHWNSMATEIAIVLHGQGMVRVVCPTTPRKSDCKNMRFRVKEGDVFLVSRFHPMAQMSFNNDSFVFMGFSTTAKKNYPQFLAGKRSVIQALDRQITAVSFNVSNTSIDQLLAQQEESVILDCTSCAEEEEIIMDEEIKREREEEEASKRKEEEEEARRREEEEEEARMRKEEEEEARRREEKEEEAKRREEEQARKRKKEEEQEARRREEEKEEARNRKEEEEEARWREEEEEEQEEEREREEKEARRREEEREREERQKEEEGEARERQQKNGRQQKGKRKREKEAKRKQEKARKQEEERQRREDEGQEEEPFKRKGKEEESFKRQQEGQGGHGERRVLKNVLKL